MFLWLSAFRTKIFVGVICSSLALWVLAQPPEFGWGGPGGGQRGGPGGGGERELLKQFDADANGWLNQQERHEAREFVKANPGTQRGFGPPGFGPPGGPGLGPPGFGPPGFGPPGGPGFGPPDSEPPSGEPGEPSGEPNGQPGGEAAEGDRPPRNEERRNRPGPPPGGPRRDVRPGGGPPGMGAARPPANKGEIVDKASVAPLQGELYDPQVLRTIFIDFENEDWETELEDFHGSDVDVAASLTVDGKTYENCGVHFRGMSSYGMVPAGYKRSLNVSLDMADKDQRLLGYKTLNLLNGASDESMLSSVLYSYIARQYMPAPKANFVRVVINGENWGLYSNVQQFNKEFLVENYNSDKGSRWKVAGSPAGGGGLDYRGEELERYGHPYEQKSGGKKATARLIELCRVLEQTPAEALPAALEPLVDVDELLWFLALDNALINSDGYWVRASDYSIYLDGEDRFHFIPHDMNEAFRGAGGPGGPGGPGGRRGGRGPGGGFGPGGIGQGPRQSSAGERPMTFQSPLELDPLIGMDDRNKPLRSKVLAVPMYREQYLANVRQIAETSLDWNKIGPFIESQAALIDATVKTETRKLATYEAFVAATRPTGQPAKPAEGVRGGHGSMNLQEFMEGRRKYLLEKTQ